MQTQRAAIMLGLIAVLGLLAACGGGQPAPATATIDVTATDFAFTPNTWSVPAGSTVTVNLTNNGTQEHEWVLLKPGTEVTVPFDDDDEAKVFWEIEAEDGQTVSGSFTAPADAGTYTVVCGVPAHIESGMQGTLTVR
jgi:plastocyanin